MKTETKLQQYVKEYSDWSKKLLTYVTDRFDPNYKQYTAYAQTKGTKSKISDPVAPELTERQIQKLFERDPKFFVLGRGLNLPKEVTNIMGSTIEYFWTNPEMIQSTGTMRSKLKVGGREFCIIGNLAVESYYNSESDTPDMRVIPIEDVIFDPTKTLKTSPVYYIRQFVDLKYLEDHKEITKDGKKRGMFQNIDKIKEIIGEDSIQNSPASNKINRSGGEFEDNVGSIELVTRYEGSNCYRFIVGLSDDETNKNQFIQEYDNDVLKEDPLDFAMDIELPKQPYALSYLDFIKGLTTAKDLFLNQAVDYGAKALNPPLFVDPSIAPINKPTLANAYKLGGIIFANPAMAEHKQMPPMNPVAFELLNYMQQRSESVTGVSAYLGGITNSESDKTQGTKGGIEALMSASASPVKDRQQNLEESIIEPVVNKWLKMAGALMTSNEIKYVFISGQSPKWVKVTKGILTGQITLNDLIVAEILTTDQGAELAALLEEQGKDPRTEIIYDVDWLVRVETGSMAEIDSEKEISAFKDWVGFNSQFGVPLDMQKVSIELAQKAKIKEPEQYFTQSNMGMPNAMGQVEGAMGQMGEPPMPQGMPNMKPNIEPPIK